MDLQEYLRPKVDLDLKVEYVNFVSTIAFDFFSFPFIKYKVDRIIPGKLVSTQNINFYLNLDDSSYKSLLIWVSDETKEELTKFSIPNNLFRAYLDKLPMS